MIFHNGRFQIINKDILKTTDVLDNSIDLIITSPPYNLDIQYNSNNDLLLYEDYLSFSSKWMSKCFQWLKPDGRFCINIPMESNKGDRNPTGSNLTQRALDIGFKYKTTIIWNKNTMVTRTAWGSWKSASAPNIITPVELIVVLYKNQWKKINKGESDIEKDEFVQWTNGLWTFGTESKKRIGHPAPFPIELPNRCIKMFSYVDDIILDPFLGSGTTLIAAHNNKRQGIGIELDKKYYDLAVKRFKSETEQIHLF